MIFALIAALTVQTPGWIPAPEVATVGDTVRLTRSIVASPDVSPNAPPLTSSSLIEPLAAPVVAYSEGAVVIRYTVAFFETGNHAIAMPDIELTYPDGTTEHVFGDSVRVDVRSVLPAGDSLPLPRDALDPFSVGRKTPTPLILLGTTVLLGLFAWAYMRRRTLPRPKWDAVSESAVEVPIMRWIKAGESRAVVGALADRLRAAIEDVLPEAARGLSTDRCIEVIRVNKIGWSCKEAEDVLRSLDRARFAPAVPTDVALLIDQVDDLIVELNDLAGEEAE